MTMNTSITSEKVTDGQKMQVKRLAEDAINRASSGGILPDKESGQMLVEKGDEFQSDILTSIRRLSASNKYKDEEFRAAYGYPKEYKGPKPIADQVKAIAEIFGLDPALALEYAKKLPVLPEGAEGWFAIPSVDALVQKHFPEVTDPAEKYCRALQLVHQKIAESRSFYNYRDGQIDTAHIKVSARTLEKMNQIAAQQKGDPSTGSGPSILIIAAQLGKRHGGRSVRRAREVFTANEYGLTSVAGSSIVLVHPERLVRWEELDMDMAGDEFSDGGGGSFGRAPYFLFDGKAGFDTEGVSYPFDNCGSASGFVSQ